MCNHIIIEQQKENLIFCELTSLLEKMTLNINYVFDCGQESLLYVFCCYFSHKNAKGHYLQKYVISLYISLLLGPRSGLFTFRVLHARWAHAERARRLQRCAHWPISG